MGNRAFASLRDVELSNEVENCMQSLEQCGKTAILAVVNGSVCAVLGVADEIKADAAESIQYLRNMGIDVWMVTGDNKRTATSVAKNLALPMNRVIAEALPVAKVNQVKKLQSGRFCLNHQFDSRSLHQVSSQFLFLPVI